MKSLSLLFCLLISVMPAHDIHISLTELEINTSEQVAQLSVHIFLDDLESVLSDSIDLQLFTTTEASTADMYLMTYLRQHIQLSGLADSLGWQLVGRELSDDMQAAYFYLESAIAPLDVYDFRQTVLFDLFDDQQSICDIRIDGRKQHVLLHVGQPSVKLDR